MSEMELRDDINIEELQQSKKKEKTLPIHKHSLK